MVCGRCKGVGYSMSRTISGDEEQAAANLDAFWDMWDSDFLQANMAIAMKSNGPHLYIHADPDAPELNEPKPLSGRLRVTENSWDGSLQARIDLGTWASPLDILHELAHVLNAEDSSHGQAWEHLFRTLVIERYGEMIDEAEEDISELSN